MRRAVIVSACCALALGGCAGGADNIELTGETWQVVALHTEPGTPGELPADAAGKASLRIAGNSMTASTGCAPLRATVEQTHRRLTLVDVEVADASGCIGGSRYVHDELTALLTPGAAFDVRKLNDKEATLTVVSDAVDRPSVRVMAL
ncbi:hypothetical protein [Corynebacterium lipophiloflavum]|uniref:DUF306 domain-containing protein n=1 Tax=Corynebacterium lipophiloflavum (strain ATCC 700352 / DSM 44291 / CCUG 37336 / JCM 10383 / DMMZ 1944) TaxID=525263 RepID=C0XP88_CORLD|nr:hypothetical protein [Corynebacterium lipophiloflavum]EEI17919.1 hypothetical protein HMPREF0298_0258 [Corynebacterium lipophiloflavum DSM 44291]